MVVMESLDIFLIFNPKMNLMNSNNNLINIKIYLKIIIIIIVNIYRIIIRLIVIQILCSLLQKQITLKILLLLVPHLIKNIILIVIILSILIRLFLKLKSPKICPLKIKKITLNSVESLIILIRNLTSLISKDSPPRNNLIPHSSIKNVKNDLYIYIYIHYYMLI